MLSPQQSLPGSTPSLSSRPDSLSLVRRSISATALQQQQIATFDFQELTAFERVLEQYARFGVHFEGAIALEPSNPLFQSNAGTLILMPVVVQSGIAVRFEVPMQRVGAFVCSVRPVLVTAFDSDGNTIEQNSTSWDQVYNDEGTLRFPLPQQQLEIQAPDIAKVVFHSYAPFTLADFYCAKELGKQN
jgi:hypothetical protein